MPVFRNLRSRERYIGATTLNFVWRHDTRPIYIMDNHRGALWCWLRELGANEPYDLVHIDGHWDLADPLLDNEQFAALGEAVSLDDMDEIRDTHPRSNDCPAIRWDNFIAPLLHLRPKLHRGLFLVTQDFYDTAVWDTRFKSCSEIELVRNFDRNRLGRQLLDIDLDYFFNRVNSKGGLEPTVSVFISKLLRQLQSADIITIALSPSCSGGQENAVMMCRAFCGALGIEVPKELMC